MKNSLRQNVILLGFVFCLAPPANATLVTWVFEGNLSLTSGPDYYSLDGASFDIRIDVDINQMASDTVNTTSPTAVRDWYRLPAVFELSDRPNGFGAVLTSSRVPDIYTYNVPPPEGDQLHIVNFADLIAFNGLIPGGLFITFNANFLPESPYSLPIFSQSDIVFAFMRDWQGNPWGNPAAEAAVYQPIFTRIATVPVPGAMWLFGSAVTFLALRFRWRQPPDRDLEVPPAS